MSAAHAAVLVGLVRLWHAHIGDRTRAEITGQDHLGRAEITGRDYLGPAEITRAGIVEGRDHRTPTPICRPIGLCMDYILQNGNYSESSEINI